MKTIKLLTILALMLLTSVTAHAQNSLVGDVNKDGSVNIADVTMVVDIILHGQKELSLSVTEISLEKGNSATIVITSGYGSYTVSTTNTYIAEATLIGSTVVITGKNGGTTVVKVIDTISGNMKEVSVKVNDDTPISYPACPDGNHPHLIDLSLPSGTKWACCNVGADKPEAFGGYYEWGAMEENGSYANVDYNISGTEYDVAHVKWGGNWRMPTFGDIKELLDNCTSEWVTHNNVNGRKFTSKINGSSIFLPATGYRYWSSMPRGEYGAHDLSFGSDGAYLDYSSRHSEHSVRPVCKN